LHNSCIVMLSALLQGYVEDAFLYCARRCLRTLTSLEIYNQYQSTIPRWGNPHAPNIERLFLRIGMTDILSGLSWQGCSAKRVKEKLEEINRFRNQIAHSGYPDSPISLVAVRNLRNFVERFALRFGEHVSALCP
jgi:RiboL-PSP-HEPN